MESETSPPEMPEPSLGPFLQKMEALAQHVDSLHARMDRLFEILEENRLMNRELRQRDQELHHRDLEIERLKRDLVYQKRLFDKESEDREKSYLEKLEAMREGADRRLELERAHFEARLLEENKTRDAMLAQQREHFEARLVEMKHHEGLWSRLVRMMTWS